MSALRRGSAVVLTVSLALGMLVGCTTGTESSRGEVGGSAAASSTAAVDAESTPSSTPTPQAQSCLDMAKGLSREQQVGQLLMVGATELDPGTAVEQAVTEHHVGSVLYLGSHQRTLAATAGTSADLQSRLDQPIPVLFSTDQEGGQVQRLDGQGFTRIPTAIVQGALDDARLRQQWTTFGKQMRAAGVRYDLAPVADVVPPGTESGNAAIGALGRHYGTDSATVAAKTTAVVEGLKAAGVASSLKHYPGLGRAAVNTDFGEAVDDVTTLDDAASFTPAMQAGASSVMISSTKYTKIDPGVHAVFSSKLITDGLRGKHGWQKVVISDDLGAAAAVKDVPVAERGARFVAAGGDLVINADAASIDDMAQGILAKADQDKAFGDSLPEHAARVLALKSEVGLVECSA